jgi:hypothetical protein
VKCLVGLHQFGSISPLFWEFGGKGSAVSGR